MRQGLHPGWALLLLGSGAGAACQPRDCMSGFDLRGDGYCYELDDDSDADSDGEGGGTDGPDGDDTGTAGSDDTGSGGSGSDSGEDSGGGGSQVVRLEGWISFSGELGEAPGCGLAIWTSEAVELYGGRNPDFDNHDAIYTIATTCPTEPGVAVAFGETLHVYEHEEVHLFAMVDGDGDPGTPSDFGIAPALQNPIDATQAVHTDIILEVHPLPSGG